MHGIHPGLDWTWTSLDTILQARVKQSSKSPFQFRTKSKKTRQSTPLHNKPCLEVRRLVWGDDTRGQFLHTHSSPTPKHISGIPRASFPEVQATFLMTAGVQKKNTSTRDMTLMFTVPSSGVKFIPGSWSYGAICLRVRVEIIVHIHNFIKSRISTP